MKIAFYLDDHLFDVFGIGLVHIFGLTHLTMMLAVDFGQNVTAISGSALDLAALLDFEAFDGALDAFHFRHEGSFLLKIFPAFLWSR